MPARSRSLASMVVVLFLAAACGSTASPTPVASVQPVASAASSLAPVEPSSSVAPAPSTVPSPSAAGSFAPNSTPAPVAWSPVLTLPGLDGCFGIVAAVDDSGGEHVAAACERGDATEIRYANSPDNVDWTTTPFPPPAHRLDSDPQLAFDGSTLYLAFTRQAPTDGGCGDSGLTDVGVYLQSRTLPGADFGEPQRIGPAGDHLESMRAANGVVHLTVTSGDGAKTWYERLDGTNLQRVAIPGAAGPVALRIGDDGTARIAYEGAGGIRFGTVDANGVSTEAIPGSAGGYDPIFILEPGNVADVLWNRADHGGGCAGPGPDPKDGTYFATNAGGHWATTRISTAVGASSIAMDPKSGDVLALVDDGKHLALYEGGPAAGGGWIHQTIRDGNVSSGILRANPNGALFVAYVVDQGSSGGGFSVKQQSSQ